MNNELTNFLFLLQLEEYDTKRFLALVKTRDISQIKQQKKQLIWTLKARILYSLAKFLNALGVKPLKALVIATKILSPGENALKNLILVLAKLKLLFYRNLIVIGITGSYGKTSVKEILSHLLASEYQVLKTPESYNTPLGIAKIILTQLSFSHQVFIVEMGAYKIGDIKKLCDFVHPKIGILTAIGKQHLERFGSLENIMTAKSELLISLPKDGLGVTNGDNIYCRRMAQKLKVKTVFFSTQKLSKLTTKDQRPMTINAFAIATSQTGSSFKIKTGREVVSFQTSLLGIHNIANILAAIAVAWNLNISWDKISSAISTLLPIPHRLQILGGSNNTTIIDDAYNANPDSVKAALAVLKAFPSPRKIVVTPGLVELGKEQNKENERMGQEISKVADYLLIVGNTNKSSLKKGFLSSLGDNNKVRECASLSEATKKLQEIVIPQSVILFENDLPDQYL